MLNGVLDLSLGGKILALLILTQITIAAVTLYLHRGQAHRALELNPIISHFFRLWLWLTTGMVTREWVAVHRKHHAKVERDGDPHSPQVFGLRKVLLEGTELYREATRDKDTLEKYGYGCPDDFIERKLYTPWSKWGIAIMFIADIVMFGLSGIWMWGIQMLWIPFFAAGVVNGIGHALGYRNFASPDASRNIIPWGIFIGGEELHNNHHAFASSAKLSAKWWEVDIGWIYLRILSFFRLATIKRVAPRLARLPGKRTIDFDTLKAVFGHRFDLLSQYSRQVIKPLVQAEFERVESHKRSLYRRAWKLFNYDTRGLNERARMRLNELLASSESLKKAYDLRQQFIDIWSQRAGSQKELLDALRDWCKRAEASGVASLKQFVGELRTYVPAY